MPCRPPWPEEEDTQPFCVAKGYEAQPVMGPMGYQAHLKSCGQPARQLPQPGSPMRLRANPVLVKPIPPVVEPLGKATRQLPSLPSFGWRSNGRKHFLIFGLALNNFR